MVESEHAPIAEILEADTAPVESTQVADAPAEHSDATNEPTDWSYKAVKSEREKRQALERRLVELETERSQWTKQQEPSDEDRFFNDPLKEMSRLRSENGNAIKIAREAAATAQHGHETVSAVRTAFNEAAQRNDPDVQIIADMVAQGADPFTVVHDWYQSRQSGKAGDARPAPKPAFPSNFATVRSASARGGPAWTGPTPLDDIFNR